MHVFITDHGTENPNGNNVGGTFWHTDLEEASKAHDKAVQTYKDNGTRFAYVRTYKVDFAEVMGIFIENGFPEKGLDEPIWEG